ncbi:hypothetical protein [Bdellovibrio svalbardensis]|uniref:Uncharacterized protein n=1 Tax=Bdellovibrio svalbardensis TaxID=2972972 RepID=A0ABT6DIX8_9BACT|nr:hypothetical protein [Bdellovibrio svalbardensis]MDG0815821.1 hypothetical protein [Bdellovibrio svalbardensis]
MNSTLLRLPALAISTALAALMLLTSEAHAGAVIPTEAEFSGYKLSLHNRDGLCVVVANDKLDINLKIKAPCQFHREPNGKLRVHQTGKNPAFLVEHSIKLPAPSNDCDTQIQAIRSVKGKLEASPVASHAAACLPFRWDQKVFDGLFSPP